MKLVVDKIPLNELAQMAEEMFGEFVKAVVDVSQEIMIVDALLHTEQECLLLELGSKRVELWGISLFPKNADSIDFIVFDSMINLRSCLGNKSRWVDNPVIQEKIRKIVNKLVSR